ncbi:hypothetical protein BX661DRAFT_180130 [Kickxella alabastrina]|uniref:uncharacterized protein n=1 Tax=Kickxella alabastrina TaxID=61397 RepID=UPI00221E7940|nr:uncharacterized protein BX661DRAFT_180130 [Kickxella alabastrina]KAI7830812.1 hypothetical protein BX661DRAFT_180130 [Kickxella alabastrina]
MLVLMLRRPMSLSWIYGLAEAKAAEDAVAVAVVVVAGGAVAGGAARARSQTTADWRRKPARGHCRTRENGTATSTTKHG